MAAIGGLPEHSVHLSHLSVTCKCWDQGEGAEFAFQSCSAALCCNMSGLVKSLLGMGNPLLDIMAEVEQATLDKYKVGRSCSSMYEVGRPF